jgi:hypothetical protein
MRYNQASYAERAYFVQVAASNQSAPEPHPLLYRHLFRKPISGLGVIYLRTDHSFGAAHSLAQCARWKTMIANTLAIT